MVAHTENAEEIFEKASALHASGKLQEAEPLYRRAVQLDPKHANAHHMLGALLLQLYKKSKAEEAKAHIKEAIHLAPSVAKYRRSLGIVHQELEQWKEALDAFELANDKEPLNVQTLMCLARALRELNRNQRAADIYASITKLQPDHPTAHYKRGALLRNIKGRGEQAVESFRQHLRLKPNHAAAKFWIAAITGDVAGMAAAPPQMIADLFDQYADHFDDHLISKLQYRTPEALRDELASLYARRGSSSSAGSSGKKGGSGSGWGVGRCVDLGCGTGLMGPLLREHVAWMEGVDLSGGMVDQARKRACYDHLAVDELVAYLKKVAADVAEKASSTDAKHARYSLVVAADVFVYIGDLQPVLAAAAAVSEPGAVFGFSVEALQPASQQSAEGQQQGQAGSSGASASSAGGNGGFKLQNTGRYAHSEGYLRDLAPATGWEVQSITQSVIRFNAGLPIHGYLCVYTKQ